MVVVVVVVVVMVVVVVVVVVEVHTVARSAGRASCPVPPVRAQHAGRRLVGA